MMQTRENHRKQYNAWLVEITEPHMNVVSKAACLTPFYCPIPNFMYHADYESLTMIVFYALDIRIPVYLLT